MGRRAQATLNHAGIGEELRSRGLHPADLAMETGRKRDYWYDRFRGSVPLTLEDLLVSAEQMGEQVGTLAEALCARLRRDNPERIKGTVR